MPGSGIWLSDEDYRQSAGQLWLQEQHQRITAGQDWAQQQIQNAMRSVGSMVPQAPAPTPVAPPPPVAPPEPIPTPTAAPPPPPVAPPPPAPEAATPTPAPTPAPPPTEPPAPLPQTPTPAPTPSQTTDLTNAGADWAGQQIQNLLGGAANAAQATPPPPSPTPPAPTSNAPAAPQNAIPGAPAGPQASTPGDLIDRTRQAAIAAGIDPDIFARQINQESGFNPKAGSPAGAQGIAQFMPQTAQGLGVDPWNPDSALPGAAKLMKGYLDKYGGDWSRALSAYNAGPGNVDKYGGIPPFEETQRYVNTILGGAKDIVQTGMTAAKQLVTGQPDMTAMVFPVAGYQGKINDHWGSVLGGSDIMADRGTPVVAMEGGKVVESGYNKVGGNSVLIQGNDGNQYYYAHFDAAPSVKVGDQIKAGTFLGPVGNTGDASGGPTHLHIGIGPDILLGADKYGGTGGDYNAVGLLRSVLAGNQGSGQSTDRANGPAVIATPSGRQIDIGPLSIPLPDTGQSPHPLPGAPGGLITPPGTYAPQPGSLQSPLLAQGQRLVGGLLGDPTTGSLLGNPIVNALLNTGGVASPTDLLNQAQTIGQVPTTVNDLLQQNALTASGIPNVAGKALGDIGDLIGQQNQLARQGYAQYGLPENPLMAPVDLSRPGANFGFDPYQQIVEQGVPSVIRGVQTGNVGDILGGALQTGLAGLGAAAGPGGAARAGAASVADLLASPAAAAAVPWSEQSLRLLQQGPAAELPLSAIPWSEQSLGLLRQGPGQELAPAAYSARGVLLDPLTGREMAPLESQALSRYSPRGIEIDPLTGQEMVPSAQPALPAMLNRYAQAQAAFPEATQFVRGLGNAFEPVVAQAPQEAGDVLTGLQNMLTQRAPVVPPVRPANPFSLLTESAPGATSIATDDVIDHLNYLGDRYDANDARILELENRLGGDVYNAGAGGGGSVIRPPWAPGWTNNALRELARVNGVDAATDLWWERAGLERGSGELRYAREQVRPGFGGGQQSAAQARAELAQLQAEQHQIAEASRAIEDNPNAAFYRPGEASQALPFDLGGTAGAYPAEGGGAAQAARAGLAAPGEIGGAGAPFGGAQPGLATTAFARLLGGGAAGGYGTYLATDPNDPNRWLKVGAGTLGGALLGGPGVDLAIRAARGGLPSTSIGDLIQATRVGSLAGGIPTLSHIALNTPVQAALKLASDVPADLLRGHWEATPSELYGAMQGFRSWALTAAQTLGHARPTLETGLTGLVGVHPILQDLANQVAQHMELWRGAATAATDAGLTRFSPQWQAEVSRLVGSPTSAMQDAMQQAGQRAALRGPLGTTGQAISDLVRSSPLARFVMPFFNIGYHVATQGLETSPLGLAGTAFDVARGLAGAGPYAQGFAGRGAAGAVTPLAQRFRNNLIGVGLAAEAYNQAGAGNITGDGPSDPNQRRALMDMGWRPNSVNIGGRYIDSHILGPVGWALTQGANVYEATHGPEEGGYRQLVKTPQGERASNPIELLGDVAARQGRYFNDETFLNSMGSVLNLIGSTAQMGRVAPQEAASTLESLIPQGALLSNIASVTDPYARQTTAPATGNIAADVWQAMQSRLPGLRESVPTRLSATGEALPNPQQGLGLLIPRSSPATGNPVLAAMAAASVTPGAPATSVPYGPSGEIRLTPQEQHTWEEYRGQVLQQAASALVQSPSWQQMPLEGQRAALTRINAAASAAAGRMLLRDIAPTIGANRQPVPTGNIAPVQAYLPAGLNDQYLNQAALVQSQLRHRALMQALLGNAAA